GQLGDQTALAHARLAADQNGGRRPLPSPRQRRQELIQFGGTPDEQRAHVTPTHAPSMPPPTDGNGRAVSRPGPPRPRAPIRPLPPPLPPEVIFPLPGREPDAASWRLPGAGFSGGWRARRRVRAWPGTATARRRPAAARPTRRSCSATARPPGRAGRGRGEGDEEDRAG